MKKRSSLLLVLLAVVCVPTAFADEVEEYSGVYLEVDLGGAYSFYGNLNLDPVVDGDAYPGGDMDFVPSIAPLGGLLAGYQFHTPKKGTHLVALELQAHYGSAYVTEQDADKLAFLGVDDEEELDFIGIAVGPQYRYYFSPNGLRPYVLAALAYEYAQWGDEDTYALWGVGFGGGVQWEVGSNFFVGGAARLDYRSTVDQSSRESDLAGVQSESSITYMTVSGQLNLGVLF